MASYRKQLEKEFRKTGITVELTTHNHIRLTLPNGKRIWTSNTPSDRRAYLNMKATVRRYMREEGNRNATGNRAATVS